MPSGYKFDLPTEAQWEYACRAGTITSLNSGENITVTSGTCPNLTEVGWYTANSAVNGVKQTHTVGEKLPNAWGLYDMHGNVWEWCLDWLGDYPSTAVEDPAGAGSGSRCVWRGGGYDRNPSRCRSAYRGSNDPSSTSSCFGFRLVLVKD